MAIKQAKIIAITSVKGGVGKSVFTLNLAGTLELRNIKTLIVDLDLHAGGLNLLLKLETKRTLFDAVDDLNNNRFDDVNDYVTKYSDYIDIISSPKDPRDANKINGEYISLILYKLKMQYDVILIDTNHFLDNVNLMTFDLCDEIIYIIDNDYLGLKNMRTMVSIYSDMDKKDYKIILNESANKLRNYFTKYDIKNMIGSNIDYTIPSSFYIKNIEKYFINGKIPILDKKVRAFHKDGIKNFDKISKNIYSGVEIKR